MFKIIPIENIIVNRDNRQRQELTGIEELANSIAADGLINPITVNEKNELICGERRLAAHKHLGLVEIAVHYFEDLPEIAQFTIELQENLKRESLSWQDTAAAVIKVHEASMADQEFWSREATGELLGMTGRTVGVYLRVGLAVAEGDGSLAAEKTLIGAKNKSERRNKRKADAELEMLSDIIAGPAAGLDKLVLEAEKDASKSSDSKAPRVSKILERPTEEENCTFRVGDSAEFMRSYAGTKFNFLHCDFPYGINHQDSEMGGAVKYGSYEDSEDVYWNLCDALISSMNKVLQTEAHIMFWLSMEHYEKTVAMFSKVPNLTVYKSPMVWLKSCNTGIVKDPKRTPRNVLEYCLYMNRGGKEIITNVANAYSAPSGKANRLHQSEKPVPVLKHFFRMFVDQYTKMLDPTCGAGSAIRAASCFKVREALGVDLDPSYIDVANTAYREHKIKADLNKRIKGE